MYIGKDEGLPFNHRIDITEKVINIAKIGESFVIKGNRGLGKSKYLRHIANSEGFKKKISHPNGINFKYLNLNSIFNQDFKHFVESLCKLYEIQGEDLDNLSTKLDQSPYVECLILDQAELIADIDKEAHKLLCSLLSAHKRKFSVLISCNSSRFLLEHSSLEYVKDHTSVQIEFTPQNKEQIILTISQFIKMFNLEITSEQKHILAQKSQGSPLFVKQVLTGVRAGISFEEAIIKFLDPENPFKEDLDTIKGGQQQVSQYRKYFTRNQYLFFKAMVENKGNVVTRDEFAQILSPQSNGVGVSNNSIDQNITRVRKVIEETRLPFIVKSKRGVGYILE